MWGTLEVVGAQGVMGTPTSWLVGDAPVGRLLGTLTFSQLSGERLRVLVVGTLKVVKAQVN